MSPYACQVLVEQILPALACTVPRTVYPTDTEDAAELLHEGIAIAANMLEADERAGRTPIPASVVYYSVQRLKSGRRSQTSSTVDVLSPLARRANGFAVVSLDEPVAGCSDADGEDLRLGDLLACRRDDPATEACRRLDWAAFDATQSERERSIMYDLAAGEQQTKTAARLGVSGPRLTQIKAEIGRDVRFRLGDDILAQATGEPQWRQQLRASRA